MNEDKARPLGEWLRQRREELGISLEQAEEDTRIRARYLEALEAENFENLPGPVVGRGFLRNYAAYLELDAQEASNRYSNLVSPPEPEGLSDEPSPFGTEPFRPLPLHKMPSMAPGRRWVLALVAVALVVAVALLAWWSYPRVADWLGARADAADPTPTRQTTGGGLSTATHTPTATSTRAVTASATTSTPATPTLELSPTPSFTPSLTPTPTAPVYTGIFLELVFTDTSWIQVTVDGVREFQGELEVDTYRSWYGEERIELRIGNAGSVLVTVNGEFLGTLGAPGEVVDRVFEKVDDGVIESTVTPVVTGTITVEPTAAPTNSPTVAPTTPPTSSPTVAPTTPPTNSPTVAPTTPTTNSPTAAPTTPPTIQPTATLTPTATITATTSP